MKYALEFQLKCLLKMPQPTFLPPVPPLVLPTPAHVSSKIAINKNKMVFVLFWRFPVAVLGLTIPRGSDSKGFLRSGQRQKKKIMSTNDYLTELPLSVVHPPPPQGGIWLRVESCNCIIVASHLALCVFLSSCSA